jgi:histidyl-tRNA synthetase
MPPRGFTDLCGQDAWLENVVSQSLTNLHYMRGYRLLKLPVIERATSFSKEVVGSSPWPEWNERNCMALNLSDYDSQYNEIGSTRCLLIPEGTVSVARWLSTQQDRILPLKIMYNCQCFRNEPIDHLLDGHKLRQFDQFGIEILGTSSDYADLEAILLAVDGLVALGVSREEVLVRLSDIRLFNQMAKMTGLNEQARIECKELLDAIAETRAKRGDVGELKRTLYQRVDHGNLDGHTRSGWDALADTSATHQDLGAEFPTLDSSVISGLRRMSSRLGRLGVKSIVDLAVVRSHEYYTSTVMEVDVCRGKHHVVEIAGGGRYDRLIAPFLPGDRIPIPAVGYSYGLQRVCRLVSEACDTGIRLAMSLVPAGRVVVASSGDPARDFQLANTYIRQGIRADVFVGDDNEDTARYAQASKARIVK